MKSLFKIFTAALFLLPPAGTARAEMYIGGSLGHSAMVPTVAEDAISQWNAVAWGPGNDCDSLGCYSEEQASGGLKFFVGYKVNPYFAVEGYLAYLGSFDSYGEDGYGVYANATADVGTLEIAAVGMIPLGSGRVRLLGKLGAHSWSAEGDIYLVDVVYPATLAGIYEESGVDMMGGIGVEIGFGDRAAMRIEFEYFAATTDYTEFGVDFLSVGGMYRF